MSEERTSYNNRPKDVDFGLPTIQLKPLSKNRDSIDSKGSGDKPKITSTPSKKNRSSTLALSLILLILVISAGIYYAYDNGYLFQPKKELSETNIPPAISENENGDLNEIAENDGWNNEGFSQTDSSQNVIESDSAEIAEPDSLKSSNGSLSKPVISEIPTPTGKYHIIVASVPSVELAREDGNKLLADDVSIAILYPRANRNENFRISAASFATLDEATNQLKIYRQKYGESVWVLRY